MNSAAGSRPAIVYKFITGPKKIVVQPNLFIHIIPGKTNSTLIVEICGMLMIGLDSDCEDLSRHKEQVDTVVCAGGGID